MNPLQASARAWLRSQGSKESLSAGYAFVFKSAAFFINRSTEVSWKKK
jgi:hypothetical protein